MYENVLYKSGSSVAPAHRFTGGVSDWRRENKVPKHIHTVLYSNALLGLTVAWNPPKTLDIDSSCFGPSWSEPFTAPVERLAEEAGCYSRPQLSPGSLMLTNWVQFTSRALKTCLHLCVVHVQRARFLLLSYATTLCDSLSNCYRWHPDSEHHFLERNFILFPERKKETGVN